MDYRYKSALISEIEIEYYVFITLELFNISEYGTTLNDDSFYK